MSREYFLGIDIGSTSVDVVLLDQEYNIYASYYENSYGRPTKKLICILKDLDNKYTIDNIRALGFTGSGARKIAKILNAQFFNEILSHTKACEQFYPQVRTIIDMGGEDSKIILLDEDKSSGKIYIKDFSMNTICAAGTGSFLEQQAKRLGVSIEKEFGELALKSKHPPRIAGRCSVFAKTDMIHLQQEATPDYDIIAGLCYALARNFKSNIAKGREFVKPVSFQGGVAGNEGMVRAFREILNFTEDELIIPTFYGCMGAIGAAILAKETKKDNWKFPGINFLEEKIQLLKENVTRYEKLSQKKETKSVFTGFNFNSDKYLSGQIEAFLGIDVGSISTNVVVIDKSGRVLAKEYLMTEGRPLEAIKKGLRRIYEQIGERVKIAGCGTTGSGRYLTGDFVGADIIKNEITAQATASIFINPQVDTIFEIGGQDSKYISINRAVVVDFTMNKVCAAGTGSFLEEQAEKLNINIKDEYALRAFQAEKPCALGDRCTVFMESDLSRFQQQGAKINDLIAGLSYSIAYNYLNRVVENRKIGNCIFFQGGVAFNKAVVAAFEKILKKSIIVPPHHEVTGAIGVALLAKKEMQKESSFRGFKKIIESKYKLHSFECQDCPNHCEVKKVSIEGETSLYYGSRCEKYNIKQTSKDMENLPDLFKEYMNFLFLDFEKYNRVDKPIKIGIPRCTIFYELLPLWSTFFGELGAKIVLSDETNKEIIDQGIQIVGSEPCFPIKVAHGHIINLLKKKVKYIFLPTIINMPSQDKNTKQSFNCPYVQSLPYLLTSVLDFEKHGVKLLSPEIILGWDKKISLKTMIDFAKKLGFGQKLAKKATYKAIKAQNDFYKRVQQRGEEILGNSNFQKAAVIVSRVYNGYDKNINLNLPHKLRKLGILPIPLDYLPLHKINLTEKFDNMYWRYGQKILSAARFIKEDKRLIGIYLSNFGCGPDSFIDKFFTRIMGDKPSLHLEIDEHSADVGIITRCEAFLDSIKSKSEQEKQIKPMYLNLSHNKVKIDKDTKIYIPRMGDYAFIAEAVFRAYGFKAEVFPESNSQTLYWGRKFTSGKECYPCIITTGDMIRVVKSSSFNPKYSAFFMPTTEGPCRFGQYKNFHRIVLNELGFENVPIISFNQGKNLKDEIAYLSPKVFPKFFQGLIATDLLYKLLHSYRPYELIPAQAEKAYKESLELIYQTILEHSSILKALKIIRRKFIQIETKERFSKPLIGVVGEIFVRNNPFSNENIVKSIENFGGEVWLAPIGEWIFHINRTSALLARLNSNYFGYLRILFIERLLKKWEEKLFQELDVLLDVRKEPDIRKIWANCDSYIPSWFGEAALSIGKVIDFYERGIAGVVNVMPFTCLPGNIFTSVLSRLRKNYEGLPALVLAYDGSGQSNISTRLEAFMYQANQRWTRLKR